MRKFSLVFAVALLAAPISAPSPAIARNVQKEFAEAWSQREQRYSAAFDSASKAQAAAIDAFTTASQAHSPEAKDLLVSVFDSADAYGAAAGRRAALADFNTLIKDKPSAARIDMWMQEQMAKLKEMGDTAKRDIEALRTADAAAPDAIVNALKAISYQGLVRGAVQEMSLIDQNLSSYFQAKSSEDLARRQARARFFGALGAALQQSGQTNFPNARMTQCHTTGATTNCTTF